MPNTELKVVDMPMGTGKTTGMIHLMNTFSDRQYLFVTPYKTERERIQTECPALDFHIPTNERSRLHTPCSPISIQKRWICCPDSTIP